jgi:hypothetical protein
MFLAKLPYWAFVGGVGLTILLTVIAQQFFEYAGVISWGILTSATLFFYVATIEAPKVRCEYAGTILMPGGILAMLAGVAEAQIFLAIAGVLAVAFAVFIEAAERNPNLKRFIPWNKPAKPTVTEESKI